MAVIIYRQDVRLVEWVNQRLALRFDPAAVRTIATVDDDGAMLAVVVYSRFAEHGCEMTIASDSPRWATRKFLKAAFQYPFIQLGYERVTFVTTAENIKTIDMLKRLGAKQEGVLRRWFGETDGIVFGLLSEELIWTRNDSTQKDSKQISRSLMDAGCGVAV